MAFSEVQYKNTLSNATASAAVTLTATGAGNVLIVCAATAAANVDPVNSLSGVTGTVTKLTGTGTGSSATDWCDCWLVVNASSTTSVTVSNTNSKVVQDVHVFEFSGLGTASTLDGQTNGTSTYAVGTTGPALSGVSIGANADFVFTFAFAQTSAGAAAAAMTAISDTASTAWQGTSGLDHTAAGGARFGNSWATLTGALSSDTITYSVTTSSGTKRYGVFAFAVKSASPVSTIFTRRQRGWGY
jgi:hypothetical protein